MTNTVLVAGASGLVGHAAIEAFQAKGWDVIGVSRRKPDDLAGVELLSVDLGDPAACEAAFGGLGQVTHLVYAAVQEEPGLFPGWIDPARIEHNGAMLRNLFEPLSRAAAGLQHVSLLHGTKAYGLHHPSVPHDSIHIPLREREPRIEHPNFYWVQEDYLREKQRDRDFGLTILRPTVIYGDAPGSNLNPILAFGVYAALQKAKGEPLYFPGAPGIQGLREGVDAALVGRALAWAADAPTARGEAFNITNGDVFIWKHAWPAVADAFGMEPGEQRPMSFAKELIQHDAEWSAVVEKHGLRADPSIERYVGYNSLIYADLVTTGLRELSVPFLNSTIKLRQAGFAECVDTEDMFRDIIGRLQAQRRLPPQDA